MHVFGHQQAPPASHARTLPDPKRYLITLNAHGAYSDETFALPADLYVVVPDPTGLMRRTCCPLHRAV